MHSEPEKPRRIAVEVTDHGECLELVFFAGETRAALYVRGKVSSLVIEERGRVVSCDAWSGTAAPQLAQQLRKNLLDAK